jgi:LuxR family maltose regulon positive regulatory protein
MGNGAYERTRPVVVVRAPAGYGKSTFAAQWCRSDDRPVAWLALRESDNDVVRLLSRLTEALEGLDPVDPGLVGDLTTHETPVKDVLFSRFLDDLPRRAPALLALDDTQVIEDAPAVAVLRGLANAVPEGSQLLLISRGAPPVGVARIRASGALHEVGPTDLAFDDAETARLFAETGLDLDERDCEELRSLTEGWGAGLALVAMSRARADRPGPTLRVPERRAIEDYLREEVLDLQPPDVQQFLLDTCVVDRLSAPLCAAMTRRDDGARMLSELSETNLFLVPLDDRRQWFRYHHLFRDLLRAERQRRGDPDTEDLFNRAAAWHEDHGDAAEAFEYSRRGNDFARAGRILMRHWDACLGSGRGTTLMHWLDRCAEDDIESEPQLALAAGWITGHLGHAERAHRYLAAAERGRLDPPSPDGATSLRATAHLLRAALGPQDAEQMLEDALAFVASELPERSRNLLDGYRYVGLAHLLLGHTDEAITAFDQALVLTANNPHPPRVHHRAWALGLVALAEADGGDWARAERDVGEAEDLSSGCDFAFHRLPILAARATIAAHTGADTAGALALAEAWETMPVARAMPHLQAELSLRCAEAAHRLGDDATAEAFAAHARSACHRLLDPGLVVTRLNALDERIHVVDPSIAMLSPAERRVLGQLATHRTLREIAQHLYVSRATVKTHVASIYAKLGVGSRDEAVATLGNRVVDENHAVEDHARHATTGGHSSRRIQWAARDLGSVRS